MVVAVFVMTLMVAFGLAVLSFADGQSGQSRTEREHESTFNLAEAALDRQTFILGQAWPVRDTTPYPDECLSTVLKTAPNGRCPSASALEGDFDQATHVDFDPSKTVWRTTVRDNWASCTDTNPSPYFDPAIVTCSARWDANQDRQMWVRAEGKVRGRLRTLVALIRAEPKTVTFPAYAVNVGTFGTGNNGQHTIIDGTGSLGIVNHCDLSDPQNVPGGYCQAYDTNNNKVNQVVPTPVKSDPSAQLALSDADVDDLVRFADLNGTHYGGCPSGWDPNGAVVVVDRGDCKINNASPKVAGQATCCNSKASPGLLIVQSGTLELEGNVVFHGVIYLRNRQSDLKTRWLRGAGDAPLLTITGTPTVEGSVAIDGPGRMEVGNSGNSGNSRPNIQFDPNAIAIPGLAGTAGIVQNSWREVPNPAGGL